MITHLPLWLANATAQDSSRARTTSSRLRIVGRYGRGVTRPACKDPVEKWSFQRLPARSRDPGGKKARHLWA